MPITSTRFVTSILCRPSRTSMAAERTTGSSPGGRGATEGRAPGGGHDAPRSGEEHDRAVGGDGEGYPCRGGRHQRDGARQRQRGKYERARGGRHTAPRG